jgi:hypothetical protein
MERQQILETPGSAYPPEPRFDEERTVLSARPVVPLVELNAKTGSRGWLFLTTGIAFAVLLGACAAILMVYLEQRRVEPIKSVSSQPADTQQTENVSAQADTFGVSSPNETANTLSNDSLITPRKRHQAEKIALVPKTIPASSPPETSAMGPDPGSQGAMQSTSGVTHGEQRWEEKRLRREARRDRGDNNRDPSADLFRIREIFEGARKPD